MVSINIALNTFHLPVILGKDYEYYEKLCEVLRKYDNHIQKVDGLDATCKTVTSYNCQKIINSVEKYYNADIIAAQECISEILTNYTSDSPFIVSELDKNYAFRGVAPPEIQPTVHKESNEKHYNEMMNADLCFYKARISENKLQKNDMLHIPFNMRSHVATQRFSIPGVPCLYLATTSFGCWIEMGMPSASTFQVSYFSLPTNLKVLNLCYQQYLIDGKSSYIENERELKDFNNAVEIFPLVIASSFKIDEQNRTFKSEYIISQLIMQVANSSGIDAVAYLSKRINDCLAYPQCVNIAILMPQTNIKQNDLYWSRINEIKLTEPYSFSDFQKQYNATSPLPASTFINTVYSNHIQKTVKLMGDIYDYPKMSFSQFDEWLKSKPYSAPTL